MDCKHLTRGDCALRLLELDPRPTFGKRREKHFHQVVAIPHAGVDFARFGDWLVYPVDFVDENFRPPQMRSVGRIESHDKLVCLEIFRHDNIAFSVGVRRHAYALALPERVVVKPHVPAQNFAFSVYDVARFFGDVVAQEVLNFDFPEEADSLTVFFLRIGKSAHARRFAHVAFEQRAYRKESRLQLFLCNHREKVRLVLPGVCADHQVARAVGVFAHRAVVSRCDFRKSAPPCVFEKFAELHSAVAHHVGVWRESAAVSVYEVFDNLLVVLLDEIDNFEIDPELFRHGLAVEDVLMPRAVSENVDSLFVDPRFHIGGGHVFALLFEEGERDGTVNAPRKSHHYFFAVHFEFLYQAAVIE